MASNNDMRAAGKGDRPFGGALGFGPLVEVPGERCVFNSDTARHRHTHDGTNMCPHTE